MAPDLVVTSNLDYTPLLADGEPASSEAATALLGDALGRSWSRLASAGIRVAAIVDTPAMGFDVPDCVSSYADDIDRCSVGRDAALQSHGEAQERGAAIAGNTTVLDLNDRLCDAEACLPIIDGVLIYRDKQHLTATFARTLAPALGERLTAAGLVP